MTPAIRRALARWLLGDHPREYRLVRCGIKADRLNPRTSIWWFGCPGSEVRLDCVPPSSPLWESFRERYGTDPQTASENPFWQPPRDVRGK